jgi:hypothetical protein
MLIAGTLVFKLILWKSSPVSSQEAQVPTASVKPVTLNIEEALDEALRNAWSEYGPQNRKLEEFGSDVKARWIRGVAAGSIPTLLSPGFQPMISEWDSLVTSPRKETPVLVPDLLNHLISSSINFEVNNYDAVHALQKIAIGALLGTFLSIWVIIGIAIGGIPLKWILSKREMEEVITGEKFQANQASQKIDHIEQTVNSALEGNWINKINPNL